MGLVACLLMPMLLGQTVVLLDPYRWVARPAALFEAITAHAATLCWLPNFAFEHLTRLVGPNPDQFNLASLRAVINCSELCHAPTFERFAARFAPIGLRADALQVCHAMAETTFTVTQTVLAETPRVLQADPGALQAAGRLRAGRPRPRRHPPCCRPAGRLLAPHLGARDTVADARRTEFYQVPIHPRIIAELQIRFVDRQSLYKACGRLIDFETYFRIYITQYG